jgi:hypothetical protein
MPCDHAGGFFILWNGGGIAKAIMNKNILLAQIPKGVCAVDELVGF